MEHIQTMDDFKKLINENRLVVIDFYATWCGPCKMLAPIIENLASELDDVKVVKCDVDQANELANLFEITSIPTVAYIKDKTLKLRELGFKGKEVILKNINDLLR